MYYWLSDILELIFPSICPACLRRRTQEGEALCLYCEINLPQTQQHLYEENEFTDKFKGRLDLRWGAANYYFSEESEFRNLIHALKYKNRYDIGYELGLKYAKELQKGPYFYDIDCIVPVPLHVSKLKKRSYNQSEAFARGLSHGMGIPCRIDLLERSKFTDTQTKKSRLQRLENINNAFYAPDPIKVSGRNILLIDDVMTTGSTLEACAHALNDAGAYSIAMACLAMAHD